MNNSRCTFCKTEVESIEHLLWNCEVVQEFLENVECWFLSNGVSVPFSTVNFIFGNTSKLLKGDPFNIIVLNIKQYIYNARYNDKVLSLPSVKEKLKYMYVTEKMLAVQNKYVTQFNKNWNMYERLLTTWDVSGWYYRQDKQIFSVFLIYIYIILKTGQYNFFFCIKCTFFESLATKYEKVYIKFHYSNTPLLFFLAHPFFSLSLCRKFPFAI